MMISRIVLGSPKSLEYTDSPYWISTSTGLSGMSPIWYSIPDRYTQKSCLNLSSLLWSSQNLRLSLSLSTRCYLFSAGQLGFSIFYFLLLPLYFCSPLLFVYSWLKASLLFDCSFPLPSSLDRLSLSVGIPLLDVIITV